MRKKRFQLSEVRTCHFTGLILEADCKAHYIELCICIFLCSDDDECRRSLPPCVPIAQCVNTPGSYRCECPAGYRLHQNGHNCQGSTRGSPANSSVCS